MMDQQQWQKMQSAEGFWDTLEDAQAQEAMRELEDETDESLQDLLMVIREKKEFQDLTLRQHQSLDRLLDHLDAQAIPDEKTIREWARIATDIPEIKEDQPVT